MEYRMTSFLAETAPQTYNWLYKLQPIALIYSGVLLVTGVLSLYFQNSIIEFFIDCMMGWTILSIPFVGVLIVIFDKEIKLPIKHKWEPEPKKPITYKFSMIWGILLIIAGVVALYYSNQYKKYYSFQCQEFYLERPSGKYHLMEKCDYIGIDEDEYAIPNTSIVKVKGTDLLHSDYEFCDACREWAEDAEKNYEFNRYSRR